MASKTEKKESNILDGKSQVISPLGDKTANSMLPRRTERSDKKQARRKGGGYFQVRMCKKLDVCSLEYFLNKSGHGPVVDHREENILPLFL